MRPFRLPRAIAASVSLGIIALLAACSEHVAPGDPCADHPNAKGCKSSSNAPASAASTYAQPPTTPQPQMPPTPPTPASSDAGADAAPPTKPNVPPANTACTDLARCCSKVKDTLERAACVGITVNQNASTCANAMIAYQVFGGCGHSPASLPDIFNSDKTPNSSKDCTYLERACINDPSQCDAAYQCDGASVGGTDTDTSDPCDSAPDPYCCRYPNSFDCGGSPLDTSSPSDPCDSAPDPYCCRYPNSFDCGGTPQDPSSSGGGDPCDSAPDPYCCQYPNDFECL